MYGLASIKLLKYEHFPLQVLLQEKKNCVTMEGIRITA
jgi:hypothetical protein